MDKTAIKNFAIEARKILMKTAINKAGFYGITNEGISEPIQKNADQLGAILRHGSRGRKKFFVR